MSTITREQAKDLRNAFECWQQDYDPAADKEQYEMFGLGVVAMDVLLASLDAGSDSNNHPASGPLSDYRLHRIREILSKAAAQRDGGNLGYAMSDAVKVIDGVLAMPATLPCPVHLEPGLKFGKGVRTQCMLDALRRRADYYAELEAMTPEQRAEHDAGIAEFKAMFGTSKLDSFKIPAVPEELLSAMEEVLRISDRDHEAWHKARNGIASCRAAMLNGGKS